MPTNRVDCSMTRPPVPEAPRQTIRRDPRSSTHRDDGSPLQAGYGHEVYARVSTEEQDTDPQTDELCAAGCTTIREEHASGADRSRPVLARLLRDIAAGDTLVVVRLGRLVCSVSDLLAVIEQMAAKGRISAACAIRSTPPRRRGCSRCRCWARWRNSSGR